MKLPVVLLTCLFLLSAGCEALQPVGDYLGRLGGALVDTAPDAVGDVLDNPSPGGAASALLKWLIGAAAVAGTGVAGVGTTKVVRRRRRARAAAAVPAVDTSPVEPLPPTAVDPPLLP